MLNLVYVAQVLLVFVVIGAIAVYVLDVINGMNLSTEAGEFIQKGFDMFDVLGNFGKVVVVVSLVALIAALLGFRLGGAQNQ